MSLFCSLFICDHALLPSSPQYFVGGEGGAKDERAELQRQCSLKCLAPTLQVEPGLWPLLAPEALMLWDEAGSQGLSLTPSSMESPGDSVHSQCLMEKWLCLDSRFQQQFLYGIRKIVTEEADLGLQKEQATRHCFHSGFLERFTAALQPCIQIKAH